MTFYIIDGNAYIHRAYHAIQNLTTSKGEQVNAVFGFIKMLLKILRIYKPDYIAVCLDYPAPTFRHKEFAEYKAHRKKTADELKNQFPLIKEVIIALNITIYEKEGFEADDLIATLSEKAINNGIDVVVVTGDKDALQLVSKNVNPILSENLLKKGCVKVLNEQKNIIYDEEGVLKDFEVPPENIVDYLAISGDSSDNVPGIFGIGAKTTVKLIREFGTLENIIKNQDNIGGKTGKLIAENLTTALLSKKLVTLVKDILIEVDFEKLKPQNVDNEKFISILRRLEFYSLIKLLIKKDDTCNVENDYKIILSNSELASLVNYFISKKELSFLIVTDINNRPLGLALTAEKNKHFYIPIEHLTLTSFGQLSSDVVFKFLKPVFENEKIIKITYDIKSQFSIFEKYDICISKVFDIKIASYLVNPSSKNYLLEDIAIEYLGIKIESISDNNFESMESEQAKNKFCKVVDVIFKCYEILEEKLRKEKLFSLFYDVEIPLSKILYKMENMGIKIDVAYFRKLSDEFSEELKRLEKIIFSIAGEQFNINSPKQLANILFGKLGLTPVKKIKTGFSTGEKVLNILAQTSELPKIILEYREISKLKSTFVDALISKIDTKTNRLHTQFNQTVTSTGRLSSSEPNLQNIPIKTDLGRKIRRGFVPEDNFIFVSFDYSQIDLRVLAHITRDKNLCTAFENNEDVHISTASEIFDLKKEEITTDMRKKAKGINFGIVYGQQAWGLSQQLGITPDEAQKYIDTYFEKYSGVKLWIDETITNARETGYVKTLLGRIRYLPEIRNKNMQMRAFAERTAINTPIQGTSADIIKVAMININDASLKLKIKNEKCAMLLQIHDDLLFEIRKDETDKYIPMIKSEMENAIKLDIPVVVDVKIGKNWADFNEI
ncbi:MAG: DNA polymerase I [Elusimicrobiota bacterium]